MTYFTKIEVDASRPEAVRLLSSPRRMHGELVSLTGVTGQAEQRLLWRADVSSAGTKLYVSTPEPFDAAVLQRKIGRQGAQAQTMDYSKAIAGLANGQRLWFRLRANVVKKAVDIGTPNPARPELIRGKIVGLIKEEDQLNWLLRQGERCGFSVPAPEQVKVQPRPFQRIHKKDEGRTVSLNVIQFDGLLEITDADAFRAALSSGIGRGKAYGLGLLTIAPAG